MIVVSNTSPITNLAAIGQLDLLPKLFGETHLPLAVVDELSAGGRQWPGAAEVDRAEWVICHMGVVGLLLRARELGLVDQVRPLLDGLRQKAGFYLSQPVYDRALEVAGES